MSDDVAKMDPQRRRLLTATAAVGGVAGVAAVVPLVATMSPSERAKAAGAPVEVSVKGLMPGQVIRPEWRGQPVFVYRRTPEMLSGLGQQSLIQKLADPDSEKSKQPANCKNANRSVEPDLMVMLGVCTHLGCVPTPILHGGPDSPMGTSWPGGFYCPCHGSLYDLAGRVYKNVPAPQNLEVPPYTLTANGELVIGTDTANVKKA